MQHVGLRTRAKDVASQEQLLELREQRSTNTALAQADSGKVIGITAAITQTIAAQSTLTAGWNVELRNEFNGDFTIDPNSAELIDGVATLTVKAGWALKLNWDGTTLRTSVLKRRTFAATGLAQITANTTTIVPADTYVVWEMAVGAGGAAVNGTRNGASAGCAWGDLPVKPGDSVAHTISSGVATVAVNGVTMLTANPPSGTTGGTASKHASVINGGTSSGANSTNATDSLGGTSSGSPVGTGVSAVAGDSGGAGWGGRGSAFNGGGTAGAATSHRGGRAVSAVTVNANPLLSILDGTPGARGISVEGQDGGKGAGGGGASGANSCGNGGFGGGGGANGTASSTGGAGGFGGGGGMGPTGATSGVSGFGAGAPMGADGSVGTAGAAAFLYFDPTK